MSLKTAIIDYGALDNLNGREGLEGFLIGAVKFLYFLPKGHIFYQMHNKY